MLLPGPRTLFWSLVLGLAITGLAVTAQATTVISPVLEISGGPGDTREGVLKLYNETDTTLGLQAVVEVFSDQESGDPLPDSAFLNWISLAYTNITLEPNQIGLIPFTVEFPTTATPGGYYATVFWEQRPDSFLSGAVGIQSRVGHVLLLTVEGELSSELSLQQFQIGAGNSVTGFPIRFTTELLNTGNVHLQPTGTITITNWLGQVAQLRLNRQERYLLPQHSRQFELLWGEPENQNGWQRFLAGVRQEINVLPFGKHQARLDVRYGPALEAQEFSTQLVFWFFPYRLLGIIFGTVIFLILLLFGGRRRRNSHRAHAKSA